jgi:hypothetical protein
MHLLLWILVVTTTMLALSMSVTPLQSMLTRPLGVQTCHWTVMTNLHALWTHAQMELVQTLQTINCAMMALLAQMIPVPSMDAVTLQWIPIAMMESNAQGMEILLEIYRGSLSKNNKTETNRIVVTAAVLKLVVFLPQLSVKTTTSFAHKKAVMKAMDVLLLPTTPCATMELTAQQMYPLKRQNVWRS